MRTIPIMELEKDKALESYICHMSGELLHSPGDKLTLEHFALMENCGIDSVVVIEKNEEPEEFKNKAQNKTVNIDHIIPGDISPMTIYDFKKNIVAKEGEPIEEHILNSLKKNDVKELYYSKDPQELQTFQLEKYKSLLESELFESIGLVKTLEHPKDKAEREEREKQQGEEVQKKAKLSDIHSHCINKALMSTNPKVEVSEANVKKLMVKKQLLRKMAEKPPLNSIIEKRIDERTDSVKKGLSREYESWVERLNDIFKSLKANKPIEFETIDTLVKDIIAAFIKDRYFFTNLANCHTSPVLDTYIPAHSINVCIHVLNLAAVLGFNAVQTIEIGIGACLHDIGHLLTYRKLFSKPKLDATEQQKYDKHAILGLSLVKNLSMVPWSSIFIICQHHEKINGSGRIFHCKGELIHDYAKLVAVADGYDITASRLSQYKSISNVIVQSNKGLLDKLFVKALVFSLSIYPIGSLVEITGNIICKVIGTNGMKIKQPILRSICKMEDGQMFEIEKMELFDLKKQGNISILKEAYNPILAKNIAQGF